MNITKLFEKRFAYARRKKWNKIYVLVDIHDTIIESNYDKENIPTKFYDGAKECLQRMSKDPNYCLIMWTCSHPNEINKYDEMFIANGINFNYINSNPEVVTQEDGYGCYDAKLFADVILDDKAGFEPETDWDSIMSFMDSSVSLDINIDNEDIVLINNSHLLANFSISSNILLGNTLLGIKKEYMDLIEKAKMVIFDDGEYNYTIVKNRY